MMRPRGYRRSPPHWWPENESWPPADPHRRWRRRRSRFIARFWILFGLIWWLSGVGVFSIVEWFGDHSTALLTTDRLWGVGVALVVGFFAFAFVTVVRRIVSPIGDLVGAAQRVADGDLSARVAEQGPPAVRAVATAFNNMAERLAAQEKQRRELMADIAHELRTPLSVVQGRIEGLIDGVYPYETAQLEPLLEQTRMLARLVDDLRTLANAESGVLTLDREPTDIGMLVGDALTAIHDEAARASVTITTQDDAPAVVASVDPLRLRQVIVNLVANAVRHGGAGSTVTVGIAKEQESVVVRVSDTGPGIPPEDLLHIFERFYKRRGSSGSGLGLTIARTLARAHGGDIAAENRTGGGTTMSVRVPLNG